MVENVRLTVHTNQEVFPATGENRLVYILMEVEPSGAAVCTQMPLGLCLVLDCSGSMAGGKLEHLKAAASLAVDQMTPQDSIAIVAFDERPKVIVANQPASDARALQRAITKLRAGGGTHMARGMERGLAELQTQAQPGRVQRMVVLTDGQTYGDETDCRSHAAEAGRRATAITALGLGEDWNEALLDDIGQLSGGSSDWLPDDAPDAMLDAFRQQVRTAQGTVIQNAKLLLRLTPGALPRAVWRVTPLIRKLGHRALSERDVQVDLGDMDKEQGQSVLVELMVPPRKAGAYRIAQAEVRYDVLGLNLQGEKLKRDIVLNFSRDVLQTVQTNPYVLNIVERVTAHKLQTRAFDEAAAGNIARATQKLRAAATRLLEIGEEDLANTALQEAQRLENGEALSKVGTKKLRYETRKLTQKLTD